jgi:hypothetical protein
MASNGKRMETGKVWPADMQEYHGSALGWLWRLPKVPASFALPPGGRGLE